MSYLELRSNFTKVLQSWNLTKALKDKVDPPKPYDAFWFTITKGEFPLDRSLEGRGLVAGCRNDRLRCAKAYLLQRLKGIEIEGCSDTALAEFLANEEEMAKLEWDKEQKVSRNVAIASNAVLNHCLHTQTTELVLHVEKESGEVAEEDFVYAGWKDVVQEKNLFNVDLGSTESDETALSEGGDEWVDETGWIL